MNCVNPHRRTRVSRRLRTSPTFLESVIEHIPNMIFVKDARDLSFVHFNRAGEDLLGLKREVLLGKSDRDFFPPEQAKHFQAHDRSVLMSGLMEDIPKEPVQTVRGTRYLHTKKIPLMDGEGHPRYLLGISEDITERIVSEQQQAALAKVQYARAQAERTAARLEFLSRVGSGLRGGGEVPALLEGFVNTVHAQTGGSCAVDLYDHKEHRWTRGAAIGSFLGQVPCDADLGLLESTYRDEDGVVEATLNLLYQEKLQGRLCLLIPLENSKLTWDVLLAHELAEQLAMAIANTQLYAEARHANAAKSAFLANISHEIRTPLGAILGFASLTLEAENLTPDQRQAQETILRNGQQLLRLLDDILDISKVESEHLALEALPVAPAEVLGDVVGLLRAKAHEKGLRLRLDMGTDLPALVQGDPLRMRQILLNIVGNAIKFTVQGEVKVSARYFRDGEQAHMLEVLVRDSGVGLTDEQARRLFRPFVQAEDCTARRYGGTGLGLFLSRKLARLMDGDVDLIESLPGKGSVFRIRMRLPEMALDDSEKPAEPEHLEVGDLAQLRILVVDDSWENRALFKAFLSNTGASVRLADGGREALAKLGDGVDVVLMDLQMPEMDGFETLQELRRRGIHCPVVALTAHTMKGDRERCLENGFDDYLAKPVGKQGLIQCVARHRPTPDAGQLLI